MADMEPNEKLNVNMMKFLLLCLFISTANCRIHTLSLEHDGRKEITVSTFGFLMGGTLAVNITSFSVTPPSKLDTSRKTNSTLFGFTLDKSKSPGLSSYMEGMQETCILNNPTVRNENMESIFFHFDFKQNRMRIERVGDDIKKLVISNKPRYDFLTAHDLFRRATHKKEELNSKLSDHYLVGSRRKVRAVPPAIPPATPATAPKVVNTAEIGSSPASAQNQGLPSLSTTVTQSSQQNSADMDSSDTQLQSVDLTLKDGSYQGYFLVYIQKPEEEGLYNLFFHNCLSYTAEGANAAISLSMKITEDNNGNFLTAGEMPVPALYFTFCVLFFITAIVWLSILRRSKEDVFKIHYLMLVVVVVKTFSCLFHGVNMYFIQINGIHEEAWAVLWYIVYLTRGALMFVTVLLIGAGWAFIKHVLSDKEKKLFLIVIPLQVLDRVAEVIVEESEEGNQSYMTWKEIFILVDLLCCGAILFPVVWSIRHLQEASRTDGKAAINLQKLKLFRHFYIMVVCYIYFTRIIVYLMKITLPFKLEWLTELFTELAMLVFFILTGSKFRPATDNPYLQVPLDSDEEEEIEMDEVLTKTGCTSGAVRVNQRTEGVTNHIRAHENSHEYD